MPKEEVDVTREYIAMHEENFSSSWLRKDLIGKGVECECKSWRIVRKQKKKRG